MTMDISVKTEFRDKVRRGFFDIPFFAHEILEIETHQDQDDVLNGMRAREESAIVCGNRWGKGDLVKIFGAWIAAYKPVPKKFVDQKINILNTSISQDQANIVFDKFQDTLVDQNKFSWLISDIKRSPFPHIKFRTGITWWFRNASQNGKFLEGRSYYWANFDEADLQDNFTKFLDDILLPRLWDFGGPLSWTTTPRRGKQNAYKRWEFIGNSMKAGNKGFYKFQGDARNNKFLHKSAIEKMNKLPKRLKNKNVLGMFEDSAGVIGQDALDYCELIADGIIDKPIPGRKYINTWDFARSSTFNVGVTIELGETLQLRSWERRQDPGNKSREYWQLIAKLVKQRHLKFTGLTGIDATGLGDVLGSFLSDINPVLIKFNPTIRGQIIEHGISTIQAGQIGLPLNDIQQVIEGQFWGARDELSDFDPEATDNIIWDFACALFIGIWLAKGFRPNTKSPKKRSHNRPKSSPRIQGVNKYATV